MQCDTFDEPQLPARQPLSPRPNDATLSPAPGRLSVPPVSLPPPSYIRQNGGLLSAHGYGYCKLLKVFVVLVTWEGRKMVVKYGGKVSREEGEVMQLVGQRTRVPVPQLLGIVDDAGETFIYQEYIEGRTLDDAWKALSSAELDGIKSDFAFILSELACLSAPPGIRLGACDTKTSSRLGGPCHVVFTQKPWIRFEIGRRSRACVRYSPPANVEDCLVQGGVTLVNADLHGGNIIVKDGRIAAIIDWGLAAWLPRAVEPFAVFGYIQHDFFGRAPVLKALLASFNLEEETLEGFRILSKVFFANTDLPTTDDDDW